MALSLNLHRRHLNESQRALVAARLSKWLVPTREAVRPDDSRSANLRTARKPRYAAAAMVNVSRRLVDHACRVINDGSKDLIAAVESGGLAASIASVLVALPPAEQAQAVAAGPQAAARKARELRARQPQREAGGTSPGSFGVLGATASAASQSVPTGSVVFLWVDAAGLDPAIAALYRYATGPTGHTSDTAVRFVSGLSLPNDPSASSRTPSSRAAAGHQSSARPPTTGPLADRIAPD